MWHFSRKLLGFSALSFIGLVSGYAQAEQGAWLVRGRAVSIEPANKSSGSPLPADAISVSSKVIPEADISYFFTPNIAAELILTYPQKHNVSVSGLGTVGSFKQLPPTLTAQYHFLPEGRFSPYVGVGVNYTRITDVDLSAVSPTATLSNSSTGLALQLGANINLDKSWSLNLDVKKIQLRTDLSIDGDKISTIKVDPWLFGVGVGYRF